MLHPSPSLMASVLLNLHTFLTGVLPGGLPISPLQPPLLTVVSSMTHTREVLLSFPSSSSLLSSLPLFLFETGSQYKACDDSKLSSSCLSLLHPEITGMVAHTYLTAEFPIHFVLILMKL